MLLTIRRSIFLIILTGLCSGQANADQTISELLEKISESEITAEILTVCEELDATVEECFRLAARAKKTSLARFLLTDERVEKIDQLSINQVFETAVHESNKEILNLLIETQHFTLQDCFRECAREGHLALTKDFLKRNKDNAICKAVIYDALEEATCDSNEVLVEIILDNSELEPVDLADCCAIANANDNEDLVETFDNHMTTFIAQQGMPTLVAVVLAAFYLQRSRAE